MDEPDSHWRLRKHIHTQQMRCFFYQKGVPTGFNPVTLNIVFGDVLIAEVSHDVIEFNALECVNFTVPGTVPAISLQAQPAAIEDVSMPDSTTNSNNAQELHTDAL